MSEKKKPGSPGSLPRKKTGTTAKATAKKASPASVQSPDSSKTAAQAPANNAPPFLASAPLAYENPAFLNSPNGRLIRIAAEFMEPLARFRRERIQDTVVFFGSARFRGKEEANHELELLDNTGSRHPAPSEEQPASIPDIAAGKASNLQRKRAIA